MLVLALLASISLLAAVVWTQEPQGTAVAVAVGAIAVAFAAIASLVLLGAAQPGRSARARASRTRAVRRGLEVGGALGVIAGLQAIGGLTPLTALFVILSFAIAEYVLSTGAMPSR